MSVPAQTQFCWVVIIPAGLPSLQHSPSKPVSVFLYSTDLELMSNLHSGALPWLSGSLKPSPEGAWSDCSGAAGFAFLLVGLRTGTWGLPSLSLPHCRVFSHFSPVPCRVSAQLYTLDTETSHLSSGIWGKHWQKMAQRMKSKWAF